MTKFFRNVLVGVLFPLVALAGLPPVKTTGENYINAVPGNKVNANAVNLSGSNVTSTLPITNGGTGQITANAALNALLPSQTGNSGKALFTDGANSFWAAAAGSGTVTNVTSPNSTIDIANPTTTPAIDVHFPISAPNGSAGAPSYRFDSDTGMYSPSDGVLRFSTNAVQVVEFTNNQQAVFSSTVQATDFIYPTKTANTFLAGPTTGSPAVPAFRAIAPGDLTYDDIPFPLNAPGGTAGAPSYNFDSDSGMFGVSDGVIGFSTNGTERFRIENNGDVVVGPGGSGTLYVNGPGIFTGNISAANYPPVDSANTLARFDNAGTLDSSAWSIDPDYSSLTSIVSPASGTVSDFAQIRTQTNLSSTVTGVARTLYMVLNNSGTTNALAGVAFEFNLPVDNDATLLSLGTSNTTTVGNNLHVMDIGTDSPVVNDYMLVNAGSSNTVGGNYTGYYLNDGTVATGQKTLFSGSHYGSSGNDLLYINVNGSGNSGGNFRGASLNNSGTVAQFASGFTISQSGAVTKGFDAFSANVSADVGDGSGVNLNGLNLGVGSGITVDGNLFLANFNNQATVTGTINGLVFNNSGDYAGAAGLNVNNSGSMTGDNTFFGAIINNTGTGYRYSGFSASNNANMTEEIRGFQFNTTGDSRTATGMDISMTGNCTDDCQGIRVNVGSQTSSSTTSQVYSGQFQGGLFGVQSAYTPFNGTAGPVDIGNNISATATIQSGSPLTSADMFIGFFQSNLLVQDDISMGPIGLGTTMNGFLSQIAVDSGKTVPLVRSVLIGTSVPSGSGGTITEHHVVELLGLPSFGGSVTNPTRVGLLDAGLLGQDFCNGATDCWFIKNMDGNAENYLSRLAIGLASKKVTSGFKFDIEGDARFDGAILTTGVIKDASTNDSIDPSGRELVDSGGNNALNWGSRILRNTDGDTVADWSNADQIFELKGHLRSGGSFTTTANVNANAGTGATCTADTGSTDMVGGVTLVTGTLSFAAGEQCSLAFGQAYAGTVHCQLTPRNDNAAMASSNASVRPTSSALGINFVNADITATTYEWDYDCKETP